MVYIRGDIFLIPLLDGNWGVGQVLGREKCLNSVAVSLSTQVLKSIGDDIVPIKTDNCFSALLTLPQKLESGIWPIVERKRVKTPLLDYPFWKELRFKSGVGTSVTSEALVEKIINVFHHQLEWDFERKPFELYLKKGYIA